MCLGSREQLCCNPEVHKLPTYAQKVVCNNLGMMCHFRRQPISEKVHDLYYGNHKRENMLDIEDLYKTYRKQSVCPYFVTRDTVTMIEAQMLLMPYNYMMDPYIRNKLNVDFTDCVLIIDEAHNIV